LFIAEAFTISGPLFWFPLLAAMLFAMGALFLKRTAEWKIDIWRTTFASNISTAVLFLPLLVFGGTFPGWQLLWQPLVIGVLFVIGQVTAVIALTRGEVSIATPVLGLKIVLVAIFSALLIDKPLPSDLWIACIIATVGVIVLNWTDQKSEGKVILSVVFALLCAAAFGMFDVCVQMWSPQWGIGRLLPFSFGAGALLSLPLIPLFEKPLKEIPKPAWKWLALGCGFIAVQSLAMVCSVGIWGEAAAANVIYSTRGVWGVLVVWLIGPYFNVFDKGMTGRVIWYRLAGAAMLMLAVSMLIV